MCCAGLFRSSYMESLDFLFVQINQSISRGLMATSLLIFIESSSLSEPSLDTDMRVQ